MEFVFVKVQTSDLFLAGGVFRRGMPGTLSKPRWQRQRERRQTKGLMSKKMAVHVRYRSSSISLPSYAK